VGVGVALPITAVRSRDGPGKTRGHRALILPRMRFTTDLARTEHELSRQTRRQQRGARAGAPDGDHRPGPVGLALASPLMTSAGRRAAALWSNPPEARTGPQEWWLLARPVSSLRAHVP